MINRVVEGFPPYARCHNDARLRTPNWNGCSAFGFVTSQKTADWPAAIRNGPKTMPKISGGTTRYRQSRVRRKAIGANNTPLSLMSRVSPITLLDFQCCLWTRNSNDSAKKKTRIG